MHIRATGPAAIHCVVDEGDPVVLTDADGVVLSGPHPAPRPPDRLVIDYDGPRLEEFCWGVLNPDGTLGDQSKLLGLLRRFDRVNLDLHSPGDEYLTAEDRQWFSRMWEL